MNHPWLLEALFEAALRSLVMGATILAVLRVLRIRQVHAQRTAWVLALLAAVAMPALARWPIGPALLNRTALSTLLAPPVRTSQSLPTSLPLHPSGGSYGTSPAPDTARRSIRSTARAELANKPASAHMVDVDGAGRSSVQATHNAVRISKVQILRNALQRTMRYAGVVYLAGVVLLLSRLIIGLALALRLRRQAVAVSWHDWSAMAVGDDIRVTARIRTPVTIASSILLPASSAAWDAAKLRMVLAHERAHVRQADFYVHLLAGLHCAIFWFSPFSWWLQRRLAALGEAMSDLAALQQAESRSSYAEVLLDFARSLQGNQPPAAAIAMARRSNLRVRIERLLNDQLYREAFSVRRPHPFLAASIVPIALLASATLVRVHASARQSVAPTVAATSAATSAAVPAAVRLTAAPSAVASIAPAAETIQAATPPPVRAEASAPGPAPVAPKEMSPPAADVDSDSAAAGQATNASIASQSVMTAEMLEEIRHASDAAADAAREVNSYSYSTWDGDSYAFVSGDGQVNFTGRYDDHFRDIRKKLQGEFIYYQHDGKSYIIQDPALLAEARALNAPMEALGKQQSELGRQQSELGKQQSAIGHQQTQNKIPAADYAKEIADLQQALKTAESFQDNKEISQQQLAELQAKLGAVQGRLGALQGEAAGAMIGKYAAEQGRLGAEQGKLGAEQGRLGAQQGRLAMEAQRKMNPLLDQAIKDGRAKPVE